MPPAVALPLMVNGTMPHVVETGAGGTEAVGLCILGDVLALTGVPGRARRGYLEARAVPGAKGQPMIDHLDRRLPGPRRPLPGVG